MSIDYFERAVTARVDGGAVETSLAKAEKRSQASANTVLLEPEDPQRTRSFEARGSFDKIAVLAPGARARGVVTVSSGNHAQGAARAERIMAVGRSWSQSVGAG
ncbi:MAG: hypothetical protein ACOCYE_05215 [Pseudomonadota bacterium]